MIDPVNTRDYYEYKKIDTVSGKTMENGEKFALDYGKKENKAKESEKKETDGVVMELSGKPMGQYGNAASQGKKENQLYTPSEEISIADTVAGVKGFLEKVTKSFARFFQSVRETIVNFWNSDSEGISAQTENGNRVQSVVGVIEKNEDREKTEREEEKTGDFTRSGTAVKNSDLLTYYDRRGQFVKLSGSDRNRILRGDRNEIKG